MNTTVEGITKEQIAFLKKANDITFQVTTDSSDTRHGTLQAIQDDGKGFRATLDLPVKGLINNWDNKYSTKGRASLFVASYCEVWKTFIQLVKPGDIIGIRFEANGFRPCSEAYNDIDIDVCYLTITRGKETFLKFMMDITLAKKGQYRMIQ